MNRWSGRSTALGLILTLLVGVQAGCKFETKATPATQLVVDIDAETLIRNRLHSLKIQVAAARHRDNIDEREETYNEDLVPTSLDSEALTWPVRVVFTPKHGDARRVLELTATALGADDAFVARARVVTGYVTNQIRYTRLVLETECFEVDCGDLETCRVGGCTDAFVEPRDLPLLPGPGPVPDAGEAGPPDTGPEPDAEVDAGPDAGPDAGDGGDGPPPVDPCLIDNGGCDSRTTCQTVDDVPTCGQCPSGFVDVNGNGARCEDVNECAENKGGCDPDHGLCTNTPGGRDCMCEPGFNGNGRECTVNVPCSDDPAVCNTLATCQEIQGQRVCQCNAGYEGDGGQCVDIDECQRNLANCPAHSTCTNTAGSFSCACVDGYTMSGDACVDVNECASTLTNNCDTMPASCVNIDGTFMCQCPAGYTGTGVGADGCADIDECMSTTNPDNCDGMPDACMNTVGSFMCVCPAGFSGDGVGTNGCLDINECTSTTLPDNCDDSPDACTNLEGGNPGFMCVCPAGYAGTGMGPTGCEQVNECAMVALNNCDTDPLACIDDIGGAPGYHCACPAGYMGNGQGANGCIDIDECTSTTNPDDCNANAACNGATPPGGFTCTCNAGFAGDGHGANGCMDINECTSTTSPDNCDNSPNACQNTTGSFMCVCPAGYVGSGVGDNGCMQQNECSQPTTHNCDTEPPACVDDVGGSPGYHCDCPDGYAGNGVGAAGCTDIDECTSLTTPDDCNANATCNGTSPPGSFTCTCLPGFAGDGHGAGGCTDIDECTSLTNPDNCDNSPDACMNLVGGNPGFMCMCPAGFAGSGVGDNGCVDDNACATTPCMNGGLCADAAPGVMPAFTCTCACGFMGTTCEASIANTVLGLSGQSGASAPFTGANTLAAVPITVVTATTLVGFKVGSGSGGANVRMGLYSDNTGVPGTLVAQSEPGAITAAATRLPLASNPTACLSLPAGSYWIAIAGDAAFDVGAGGGPITRYSTAHAFAALPASIGTATASSGDNLVLQLITTP